MALKNKTRRTEDILRMAFMRRRPADCPDNMQDNVMRMIMTCNVDGAVTPVISPGDLLLLWRMAWSTAAVTVVAVACMYIFWLNPAMETTETQLLSEAIAPERVVAAL